MVAFVDDDHTKILCGVLCVCACMCVCVRKRLRKKERERERERERENTNGKSHTQVTPPRKDIRKKDAKKYIFSLPHALSLPLQAHACSVHGYFGDRRRHTAIHTATHTATRRNTRCNTHFGDRRRHTAIHTATHTATRRNTHCNTHCNTKLMSAKSMDTSRTKTHITHKATDKIEGCL